MPVTESQKRIYNFYLRAYRVNNGKPFRYKKDFTDFDKAEDYPYIEKLEKFFYKYPHLLNKEFFDAPYKIYSDEKKFYGLKFYSSTKGFSTCMAYYKLLQMASPDEQIEFIKDSLRFIAEFCIEKNIPVEDYTCYKSVAQYDCFKHLKEHKLSWYMIFGFKDFYDKLYDMPEDEFELYFGQVDLTELFDNFSRSKKASDVVKTGITKIADFVRKKLK